MTGLARCASHVLGTALIACAAAACGDEDEPVYPVEQTVELMRSLPPVVYVAPGDSAVLSVRLLRGRDQDVLIPEWVRDSVTGAKLPVPQHAVSWKFKTKVSGLHLSAVQNSMSQHRHLLWADGTAQSGDKAEIEASAGGKRTIFTAVVKEPAGGSPPKSGSSGLRVLAEEVTVGSGSEWRLWSYSPSLKPSDWTSSMTKSAAELTDSQGFAYPLVAGGMSPAPQIQMPLRFWLATGGITRDSTVDCDSVCNLIERISEDLELANALFAENRLGISFFNADGGTVNEVDTLADFEARTCNWLWPEIEGEASLVPDLKSDLELHLLHVVYSRGEPDDDRGLTCALFNGSGFLVVFLYERSPTTLAHELGHALALQWWTGLGDGHPRSTDEGFDAGNLMWTHDDLRQATDRNRFLVGQAFWMHVDSLSFLNQGRVAPYSSGEPRLRSPPIVDCEDNEACPYVGLGLEASQ